MEKNGLLYSRSRSQQRFKMSVNVCPDDIFWILEHFVTKLGVVMQHHKPECPVKKLDYCIQGQGHSEGSKCQWMFVRMTSSQPQNNLLPNLVWWCSIMSQSIVRKKNCFLPSRSRSQRGISFYYIFWTVDSFATKLSQMIHYHKPEYLVEKKG